jgi:acyl-CoA dehydrogenase
MNFDFSDEQKSIKDQARRFLKDKCPPTVVRKVLDGGEPCSQELWKGAAELGWTGAVIPEEFGGIGYGYLELCVIAEELGRALAPIPFSSSVYLATEAILLAGTAEQKQKYLPRLASGEIIGTFAVAEGSKPPAPANIDTTVQAGKVSGTKVPVPDGALANFAVVAAKDEHAAISLAIVDLRSSGVSREPVETIDPSRVHARIRFNQAPAEPLGTAGDGWRIKEKVFDRAAVLIAMEQLGGADASLRMARDYALNRYAFGRPIGSFQAIKHKLADMFVKNELARSNCTYGAWALSSNAPDLPLAAATARLSADDAFSFASKENIQTHGGNGFAWEYDCHLYYRRAKLLSLTLGGPRVWKDRLVAQLETQAAGSVPISNGRSATVPEGPIAAQRLVCDTAALQPN